MAKNSQNVTMVDGSLDFSNGVNGYSVTTVQSDRNTNGLKRNQIAWMDNATVRGGGITQRTGWQNLGSLPDAATGLYQGKFLYQPDNADPYFIYVIAGIVWAVDPDDTASAVNLSLAYPGMKMPATVERVYFVQAEQFLVIQAGDAITLPLFWDGTKLRRSKGIINTAVPPGTPGVNEIPYATAMDYYMGRIWYAQGRNYSAGDIVDGHSGTLAYGFRDAVLNVTENPLCVGGDGFAVPTTAGNIRAIYHTANINVTLGQGQLYIATRRQIYSLNVPVNRSDWIAADASKAPLQVVAQINNGFVNDRSIVHVNGDVFGQSLEPSIRSFTISVRNFQQWGNTPISINENRILQFNDRSLLRFGSGIEFDNRMIQTCLPFVTPVGVAHKALIPLNFDVISTLDTQLPPVWEGMWEGMDVLELATGDFSGRQRAFATVWSEKFKNIQIWEITNSSRFEDVDNRVEWYVEFPAFTWGDEFAMKKLVSAELWLDKIFGQVNYFMDYRPDGDPCWYPWHAWDLCTARDSCEDVHNPVCVYPRTLRESFRQTISLPVPPNVCESVSGRPTNIGYQFQCRLRIKGWCRIRGLLLKAEHVESKFFGDMVC